MSVEIRPAEVIASLEKINQELSDVFSSVVPPIRAAIEGFDNDTILQGQAFDNLRNHMRDEIFSGLLSRINVATSNLRTANSQHISALGHISQYGVINQNQLAQDIRCVNERICDAENNGFAGVAGVIAALYAELHYLNQKSMDFDAYLRASSGLYNGLFAELEDLTTRMDFATFCSRTGIVPIPTQEEMEAMHLLDSLLDSLIIDHERDIYDWDAIMELMRRPAGELNSVEYQALAVLLLRMSIEDLEKFFNLNLQVQNTSHLGDEGTAFTIAVDNEHLIHIQGYMNVMLWNGGSEDEFARLFLVGKMMQTSFVTINPIGQSTIPSSIISLSQSPDGAIVVIPGERISARPNQIGRQTHMFVARHPIIARRIGDFSQGSTNITTNATRIAFAFGFSNDNGFGIAGQEGEGTMVNALRHVVWQSVIATRYGEDIASRIGYAHEYDPQLLERIANPLMHRFDCLQSADTAADLLNNRIGIDIGTSGENLSLIEVTELSLAHAYEYGFYVVILHGDHFAIELQQLTSEEYNRALQELATLDANGFPPNHDGFNPEAVE